MMQQPSGQFTSIGGQAVLEGVMMRSPRFIAVAVRKPNGKIVIQYQPYSSAMSRYSFLKKPMLRGVATLVESMVQGIDALSFSAQVLSTADGTIGNEGQKQELSSFAIGLSILSAFLFGMGLFVALPHLLTVWLSAQGGVELSTSSPWFHALDGMLKMGILLVYVYLISLMKDIKRVFQYHGAEHKSIYAFESGDELTVENARRYTTLHPRCGTSFLLFLVVISIIVFSILFPIFRLNELTSTPLLNHLLMILAKIVLMFPVAGLAYEFIKACAFRMEQPIFRALIFPGLLLQRLTTREPSDDQLEVALASLRQVLKLEKSRDKTIAGSEVQGVGLQCDKNEIEITELSDLHVVSATVEEFAEV